MQKQEECHSRNGWIIWNSDRFIHDHAQADIWTGFRITRRNRSSVIEIDKLPIGDDLPTKRLSVTNVWAHGIAINPEHIDMLKRVSERERAPMYVVGTATGDGT